MPVLASIRLAYFDSPCVDNSMLFRFLIGLPILTDENERWLTKGMMLSVLGFYFAKSSGPESLIVSWPFVPLVTPQLQPFQACMTPTP